MSFNISLHVFKSLLEPMMTDLKTTM